MSGKINDLRRVRVEIAPLNAKEDFAATRTALERPVQYDTLERRRS